MLCSGAKLTKAGAAFVNAEMIFAGGKWDTFRMLTHPGTAIMPAALVAAEVTGASGQQFLTAVAAAYEVMERMAAEFIPTVMSRGFHAGPVFGIFGAAVAAAKLHGLNADQIHSAIAQCVNLAAGNLEGMRSGGRSLREGGAVRNALLAVAMAKHGTPGGETTLEGEAGFYHSYAGNNLGGLTLQLYRPQPHRHLQASPQISASDWIFLETLYRDLFDRRLQHRPCRRDRRGCARSTTSPMPTSTASRRWSTGSKPNTQAPPSPPRGSDGKPRVGSTHYFTAYGAVTRGYPMLRGAQPGPGETDPPEVLDLMHRVTLIPMVRRTLFGPRITVFTKDGRSFTREGTGREFIWDFEEHTRRIQPVIPGVAISAAQFAGLIDTCRHLERIDAAGQRLIALTLPR